MKFDVVTQWVIAYGQLVIYPFAGLAVALENGANVTQLFAELALALSMGRKMLRSPTFQTTILTVHRKLRILCLTMT
jgi:hypothetical protein